MPDPRGWTLVPCLRPVISYLIVQESSDVCSKRTIPPHSFPASVEPFWQGWPLGPTMEKALIGKEVIEVEVVEVIEEEVVLKR